MEFRSQLEHLLLSFTGIAFPFACKRKTILLFSLRLVKLSFRMYFESMIAVPD